MRQIQATRPRILYVVREPWPTFRSDIRVLFGTYLPRLGFECDLVTERADSDHQESADWLGGKAFLWGSAHNRALYHIGKLLHTARVMIARRASDYAAYQVRDMPIHALVVLIFARIRRKPFFYWMSFPMPESHIIRAKNRGWRAGTRYFFPLAQGAIGKWVLYKIVLPRATHVFVQSRRMQDDLAQLGIQQASTTAVPMGVDLEDPGLAEIEHVSDARISGKRVLVYLGTLDPERSIARLFEVLAIVLRSEPRAILVIVGASNDTEHLKALRSHAERCGVAEHVLWTGWLPMDEAWRCVSSADIGISPFPRGPLLDSASPTKAVEYMALGLPIVVNDNPDQEALVRESGAGYCVEYEPEPFAKAILALLSSEELRSQMARKGQAYVREHRSYLGIATMLVQKYDTLLSQD